MRPDCACASARSLGLRMMKSSSSSGRRWCLSFRKPVICFTAGLMASGETAEHMMYCNQSMPYTTVQKKIAGIDWLQYIMCSAVSPEAINPAVQQITGLLRERHHLRPEEDDDFIIRSPNDLAEAQAQSGRIMTLLLASIASVSLLVGGIGIMNIMLVSVTERTREIGLRMALGATEQDVQKQFLSEAMVLSLLGGMAGVLLGVFGSRAVSDMLRWPTHNPRRVRVDCPLVLGRCRNFLRLLPSPQSRPPRPH